MKAIFETINRCLTGADPQCGVGGCDKKDFRKCKEPSLAARMRDVTNNIPSSKHRERNFVEQEIEQRKQKAIYGKSDVNCGRMAQKNTIFRDKRPIKVLSVHGRAGGTDNQNCIKVQSPPSPCHRLSPISTVHEHSESKTVYTRPQHFSSADDARGNVHSDDTSIDTTASSAHFSTQTDALNSEFIPLYTDCNIENQDWKRNALFGVKNSFNNSNNNCTSYLSREQIPQKTSETVHTPNKSLFDSAEQSSVDPNSTLQPSWDYDVETDKLVRVNCSHPNESSNVGYRFDDVPSAQLTGSSSTQSSITAFRSPNR
uniref:Uncharacterized protein n=1 Tax=Corethron hystrix TaxID=216773 RepID=A0A7S1C007_9STRA|mmetsp:Transcript_8750/g.19249  ORF Transcript_8750/g.19249 Transcript_8750/m.19249 type:complete len:314 (+) Transcript_8750:295-1236(+)|eukprot:CAMPEP_0113301774 /NCGR_PEP_ID=MMETSP0010_2-20120614/2860_1 /TAXON_ID=216773 ORGANISM="Corethron hystrix, Strain 308" /NCGR_SAMPLE_ID=MMETSP0010_2 /ASSEMBLY_ACC=CAM_ASM_000155 /LENGTH=313 /DNA_ID=CAMNT_0000155447 /DNA_START=257 /DNA_END=1198 /DNA_ORIENTATION=- /assembly_acc=CAM_ASM_000155